jgi:hypothetical protein
VILEAVAVDLGLSEQIAAQPDPRPEVVEAERGERQEHVDDEDAEERRRPTVKGGRPSAAWRGEERGRELADRCERGADRGGFTHPRTSV